MEYRKLGRKAVDVGIVGLGAEYLEYASRDTVISVVHEALGHGVNYIDLFMASPDVRDNFGLALKNKRHDVLIAGHLGSAFGTGQYYRTRDEVICREFFDDLLKRLQTDFIDVLMLHFVDEIDDYEKVFGTGGIYGLAKRLQKEGKARFIGMSGHNPSIALAAVKSGHIDLLMFPVNPAFDTMKSDEGKLETLEKANFVGKPDISENTFALDRKELYHNCSLYGVGIVGMKPFAAGHLITKVDPDTVALTPVQCVHYALSQPGVCTVVPGCKNREEMKAALAFLDATEGEKDYSVISELPVWNLKGSCMYCNHCLPCPVGIDIGTIIRLTDTVEYGMTESIALDYEALSAKASDCTECSICIANCPFDVDVVSNMARAMAIFET